MPEDLADRLVVNTRAMDWVVRHQTLRPYARVRTMFLLLQERLSPDEWIYGECTGKKITSDAPIRLWEYPHGQSNKEQPWKQRRLNEYFPMLLKQVQ